MDLRFDHHSLHLDISNSTSAQYQSRELIRHGGIGLKNVQRRLDLIYPGKHDLKIQHDSDQFRVTLQLQLSRVSAPEPVTIAV
jgi:LytS/YehU family sensor histidine kinase